MNWYKTAKIKDYPTWLSQEIQRLTNNYKNPLPSIINNEDIKLIETWVQETNPMLDDMTLTEALTRATDHKLDKKQAESNPYDPKLIEWNWNKTLSEGQNVNPNQKDFIVNIKAKKRAIPSNIKKRINKAIHDLGNYHQEIPLNLIFNICEQNNIVPLQEDGKKWSGLLIGGAECGSEKARDQYAIFPLAIQLENGEYYPSNCGLNLSWCVMPNGKYEIVSYVS